VETTTLLFVYHGTGAGRCRNLLYDKDLNSSTITKHFYAGDLRVAKIVGASTYYVHQDHLGSTRLVTTSAGGDNFSSNYKPFGPPHGLIGSEVFKYVGQREDSVTGLYAMGARYYSPTVGRFITQDPLLGISFDPQSLHRYSYARNNPLRYVDPHGLVFHPVGSTSAVTALLGQTTANLIGAVLTTGTASVTNVLARVAATTTARKQLIPTIVTTIPGSASSADSSQDAGSDDALTGNPDRLVGDQTVVDPWGSAFNPEDTYTPDPPAAAFTTFGAPTGVEAGFEFFGANTHQCSPASIRAAQRQGLQGSLQFVSGIPAIYGGAGFIAGGVGAATLSGGVLVSIFAVPAGVGLVGHGASSMIEGGIKVAGAVGQLERCR
jgi:RHS repeat-associated protein